MGDDTKGVVLPFHPEPDDLIAGNWMGDDKRNIGLPKAQWHEIEGLFQEANRILTQHGVRFDNGKIPEGEVRNCLNFFSNIIVCEKEGDRE